MKKKIGILLMISSLAVTAATTKKTETTPKATMSFEDRYDAVSNQLDNLRAKDQQRYELEERKASAAQEELDKQIELRDTLQVKYDEAVALSKVQVYSSQYKGVAAQYKGLLGDLDKSIKQNQGIINNFEKIKAAREAYM